MVRLATKIKTAAVFVAGYCAWPYLPLFNEEEFQKKIKLSFPEYSDTNKVVHVVSKN